MKDKSTRKNKIRKCPECGGEINTIYLVDYEIKNKVLKTGIHHFECKKCGKKVI